MVFEAKYFGKCENCGEKIKPGQSLTYDDGEVVHDGCAGEEPTFSSVPSSMSSGGFGRFGSGRKKRICPKCNTEKSINGVCMCF